MRILQHPTKALEAVDADIRMIRFFRSGIGFAPGDFVRCKDDWGLTNMTFGIVVAMNKDNTTVLWSKPPRTYTDEVYKLVKMTGRYIPSSEAR